MKRSVLMVLAAGLLLGGCGSSNIVGTWRATGDPGEGFSVAEATFRDDGSYSAQVVEGGREMTDSGQWSKSGKKLELQGQRTTRVYETRISGDEMTMTDPDSGRSVTLEREGN
jgi:hypothetical protein